MDNDIIDLEKCESLDCPVCLETIEKEDILKICDRDHFLHKKCFNKLINYNHETCPMCRNRITLPIEFYIQSLNINVENINTVERKTHFIPFFIFELSIMIIYILLLYVMDKLNPLLCSGLIFLELMLYSSSMSSKNCGYIQFCLSTFNYITPLGMLFSKISEKLLIVSLTILFLWLSINLYIYYLNPTLSNFSKSIIGVIVRLCAYIVIYEVSLVLEKRESVLDLISILSIFSLSLVVIIYESKKTFCVTIVLIVFILIHIFFVSDYITNNLIITMISIFIETIFFFFMRSISE